MVVTADCNVYMKIFKNLSKKIMKWKSKKVGHECINKSSCVWNLLFDWRKFFMNSLKESLVTHALKKFKTFSYMKNSVRKG